MRIVPEAITIKMGYGMPANSVVVREDDLFLRMIGVLLDPNNSVERTAAFADFGALIARAPKWRSR